MIVGKQPNHKDHDIALTNLLNTARVCNVCLNNDKLQYKQTEVDFFGEMYTVDGQKPSQRKGKGHTGNATATMQEASTIPHRDGQLFIKVFCSTIRAHRAYL